MKLITTSKKKKGKKKEVKSFTFIREQNISDLYARGAGGVRFSKVHNELLLLFYSAIRSEMTLHVT